MTDQERHIGRYKILERIGRGGMGVMYRGTDPMLDREVAIKVMGADFAAEDNDDARARFIREAHAVARLQHRNIVTVFELGEDAGVPYIVMEFLRGQSLAARMKAEPPLSLDQKLDIMSQLCVGLEFAHEHGIVHRDVKPGNVWLLKDQTVKLLDFGIAKMSSSTFTRQGDVLGSASYMSPEQIAGGSVDARSDVFSAAVVLYELVAGRRPFEADSPTSTMLKIMQEPPAPLDTVVADAPAELVAAVAKGLHKNPAERYQTAGDFGAALQLIRMSLQSTGDSVFGEDALLDNAMDAPAMDAPPPSPHALITDLPLRPADESQDRPRETPRRVPPIRPIWLGGAAIATLLLAVVAWLSAGRMAGSSDPRQPAGRPVAPPESRPAGPTPEPMSPAPPARDPLPAAVLTVVSDPVGASIEVDGRNTGLTTPAEVPVGDPAPKRIRLTKKGFQPIEGRVTEANLTEGSVRYRLQPAEPPLVKLTATGSYPFAVVDGNRVLSPPAASHELGVAPQRVLHLKAPAYFLDYPFKVDAGSGRTMQVQAPELGRITIRSAMETCQVSLQGQNLGFPPINGQSIAVGTYTVQLTCPNGQTVSSMPLTVVAGQTLIAKVP